MASSEPSSRTVAQSSRFARPAVEQDTLPFSERLLPKQVDESELDDDGIPGVVYKATTMEERGALKMNRLSTKALATVRNDSSSLGNLISNTRNYISGLGTPTCWIIVLFILCGFSLAMLIVGNLNTICTLFLIIFFQTILTEQPCDGSIHVDHCVLEPNIPIYLLVTGCVTLIKFLLDIFGRCMQMKNPPSAATASDISSAEKRQLQQQQQLFSYINLVIIAFLCAWFIAGCVWVFGNFEKAEYECDETKLATSKNCCNQTVLAFAFAVVTLQLILGTIFLISIVLLTIWMLMLGKK